MSLLVLDPGPQATLQGAPRQGLRQFGMPAAGAADPVSLAIANRLVGRRADAVAIEVTFGPARFRSEARMAVAISGADADVRIDGTVQPARQTLRAEAGSLIEIGPFRAGARTYLAASGDIDADIAFGSPSTYLPAGLGGFGGRVLRKGDLVRIRNVTAPDITYVPLDLQLFLSHSFALRAVPGPDWFPGCEKIADAPFAVTSRTSRMGIEIEGALPGVEDGSLKPSSAVMPGALQITPGGRGFLLLADGQTTGGYPHLLQVILADRHLLGQARPRDRLRFLIRTQTEAEGALTAKQALIESWIPDFRL